MKKLTLLTLILVIACLTAAAEPFKIGISLPLTGEVQEYGIASKRGVELAAEKMKSLNPEFKVNYFFDDNSYSAAKSLTSYQRLKNIKGVDLIFVWGEAPLSAVADMSQREKFPVLTMAVDTTYAVNRDYIIRCVNSPDDYVSALAGEIKKLKVDQKVVIVKEEDPFINANTDSMKKIFPDATIHNVASDEKDFRTLLLKVKAESPSSIGVFLYPGKISNFHRQMKEMGIKIQTFGTDIFDSESEVQNSNGGMEGAFFATMGVPAEFAESYRRYNDSLQIPYAYNAYAAALAIINQFGKTAHGQLSGQEIIQKLKVQDSGNFKYQESGGDKHYQFPLIIKEVKEGRLVVKSSAR